MAKTLLNGVNEVLKKLSLIQGDSGTLTTLSDSGRQTMIDKSVQAWNEVMEEAYSRARMPLPSTETTATITLVTDDRDYALASDLVEFLWSPPPLDQTNGRFIYEFAGGYTRLIETQLIPSNYTGLPIWGAIRPSDGQLYLDRIPTSNENGLIYTYHYVKDVSVSSASDTFPFTDAVFRAMVPAVAEVVSRYEKQKFDEGMFRISMGRAARLLNKVEDRQSWSRRS